MESRHIRIYVDVDCLMVSKKQDDQITMTDLLMELPGNTALDAYKWFVKLSFDMYIVASKPSEGITKWIKDNELDETKMIYIYDKYLLFGEFIVERELTNGFKGTHLLFGTDKYPNWDSIKAHFVEKPKARKNLE